MAKYNESFTSDRRESASEEDPYPAYAYDAIWTIALMLRGLGAHNGTTRQELENAARSPRVGQALERLDFTGVTVRALKTHREALAFLRAFIRDTTLIECIRNCLQGSFTYGSLVSAVNALISCCCLFSANWQTH